MIVTLHHRVIRPPKCPITLRVDETVFTGPDASSIIRQIKSFFADSVIPHIPFTRRDDKYREEVRKMSNADLTTMFIEYLNANNAPDERDYLVPDTDEGALKVFEEMGFLRIEDDEQASSPVEA